MLKVTKADIISIAEFTDEYTRKFASALIQDIIYLRTRKSTRQNMRNRLIQNARRDIPEILTTGICATARNTAPLKLSCTEKKDGYISKVRITDGRDMFKECRSLNIEIQPLSNSKLEDTVRLDFHKLTVLFYSTKGQAHLATLSEHYRDVITTTAQIFFKEILPE